MGGGGTTGAPPPPPPPLLPREALAAEGGTPVPVPVPKGVESVRP